MKKVLTCIMVIWSALLFLQCNSMKKHSVENDSDIFYEEGDFNPQMPPPYEYKEQLDSNLYVVSIKDSCPYIYGLLQWDRKHDAELLMPVKYRKLCAVENSHRFLYLLEDTLPVIWDRVTQTPLCRYPFKSFNSLEYIGQDKGEHVFLQSSRIGAYYQLVYEKGGVCQLWGINHLAFKNHRFLLRAGIMEDTLNLPELYSGVQSLCQPYASEGKLLERTYVFNHEGYPTSMLSFHIRFPDSEQSLYRPVSQWIRKFLYTNVFPEYDDNFRNIPTFNTLTDEQALDSLGYHVVGYLNDKSPEELYDFSFGDCPYGQFFIDIAWKQGPLVTYFVNYLMFYGGKMWTNHSIYVTFNLNQGKLLGWEDLIPADRREEFILEMNKYVEMENRRRYDDELPYQETGIYQVGIIGQGLVFEKEPTNTFIESNQIYLYKCDISPYLK